MLCGLILPLRTADYDRRNRRRYRRGGWGGKCHLELWGVLPAAAIYGSGDRVLPNKCKLGTAICCANRREGSGHESNAGISERPNSASPKGWTAPNVSGSHGSGRQAGFSFFDHGLSLLVGMGSVISHPQIECASISFLTIHGSKSTLNPTLHKNQDQQSKV